MEEFHMRASFLICVLVANLAASPCQAQQLRAAAGDWPWWRGPNGNGVAEAGQRAPVQWSETKNVIWKTAIPGRGHASPTVIGDRIYLATADDTVQVQSVICCDRKTGTRLWKCNVNRGGFPKKIHRKNTHASSTIACDGQHLFVAFHHHDSIEVSALDFRGRPIWKRVAGPFLPKKYANGYAASPLLFGRCVIIAADYDGGGGGFLASLNAETGDVAWKTPRPPLSNFASPVIAHVSGREQLLISGCNLVASYNPVTGKPLWQTKATTMQTCGTVVWDTDLLYASGGFPEPGIVCLRADGSGEVVWRNNQKLFEQSMLVHDGYVYAVNDNGIAFCWDGKTGDKLWSGRLRGPISASPILSNGNIYVLNELGTGWVYRATPHRFELVAENQLGTEVLATPTICGSQIFLRIADTAGDERQESLYCIQSP